jgi:predicted Zn finger-like uncharacterized protein
MIKCPNCQSTEYKIGAIKIGNSRSVDVINCAKCETVIGILGNTLKKPRDAELKSDTQIGQLRA